MDSHIFHDLGHNLLNLPRNASRCELFLDRTPEDLDFLRART